MYGLHDLSKNPTMLSPTEVLTSQFPILKSDAENYVRSILLEEHQEAKGFSPCLLPLSEHPKLVEHDTHLMEEVSSEPHPLQTGSSWDQDQTGQLP